MKILEALICEDQSLRWWESEAILNQVHFKAPPCRQTRTDSSWSDRSSGPTNHRRLTTSPHSSLASLRPAGWTGSVCATGSTRPSSRHRTGTCPQIGGRWCPARRASSPGGRMTWRSRRGPPAPFGHGASPSGRRVPGTSWTLQRNLHNCCTQGNICILSCVPSGSLKIRERRDRCFKQGPRKTETKKSFSLALKTYINKLLTSNEKMVNLSKLTQQTQS